jgi:dihydroflavonol-4-reductase
MPLNSGSRLRGFTQSCDAQWAVSRYLVAVKMRGGLAVTKTVLVTGITGFVAKHCALALLKAGYRVRGTVRSKPRAEAVRATLSPHVDTGRLEFVEAQLLSDAGWDDAMAGCHAVFHVASPFPLGPAKDENGVIRPAVEGTLRVLRAALRHGVPRFVHTSSMAAIYPGHPASRATPFTEEDWTVLDAPGVDAYEKSKTLAERAARDFIASEGAGIHYCSVNPGLVFGPLLDREFGTSVEIVRLMLSGKYPAVPRMMTTVVDVRDVARMHLLALERDLPSGGRYLGVADVLWVKEIAGAVKDAHGARARKASTLELPNWATRLIGLLDSGAAAAVPNLDRTYSVDTSRTRAALGIEFIPASQAAAATAESLFEHGIV